MKGFIAFLFSIIMLHILCIMEDVYTIRRMQEIETLSRIRENTTDSVTIQHADSILQNRLKKL